MTRFLLSHNLQVDSDRLPALSAVDLATGLAAHVPTGVQAQALSHPHWLVQVEADLLPADLAEAVLLAWRRLRSSAGASDDTCQLLALGGRKDDPAGPGAVLQQGDWGVDVVETLDVVAFLQSINWEQLKQGRAADGVFELRG
jgi:hypothetical protein